MAFHGGTSTKAVVRLKDTISNRWIQVGDSGIRSAPHGLSVVLSIQPAKLRFTLGEPDGSLSRRVQVLSEVLSGAGFDAPVREDIRWNVWLQLWGNICFSPISALTCTTLDRITADAGLRAVCKTLMAETQAVNEAHGIHIPSEMADRRLAAAASAVGHRMSMLQDLERGRSMEIDPIVTAVQELGRLARVKTPVIDVVLALLQERARVAGLYPAGHAHLEQAPNAESQDG
jgi:2-dehydropantoate 2-reductase